MLISIYAVSMYILPHPLLFLVTLPVFAALLRPHAAPVGSCFSYLSLRPLGAVHLRCARQTNHFYEQLTNNFGEIRAFALQTTRKKPLITLSNQWLNNLVAGAGFEPTTFGL